MRRSGEGELEARAKFAHISQIAPFRPLVGERAFVSWLIE